MPDFLSDSIYLLIVIIIGTFLGTVGGTFIVQHTLPACQCEQQAPAVDGENRRLRGKMLEAQDEINLLRRRLKLPPKPITLYPDPPGNL